MKSNNATLCHITGGLDIEVSHRHGFKSVQYTLLKLSTEGNWRSVFQRKKNDLKKTPVWLVFLLKILPIICAQKTSRNDWNVTALHLKKNLLPNYLDPINNHCYIYFTSIQLFPLLGKILEGLFFLTTALAITSILNWHHHWVLALWQLFHFYVF